MTTREPYILRTQAEDCRNAFANALRHPGDSPFLFHIWGCAGIGKTTLLQKLKEEHQEQAQFAEVSFEFPITLDHPFKLMTTLYRQLLSTRRSRPTTTQRQDPFMPLYATYQETIQRLQNEPMAGKKTVDAEQAHLVQQLLSRNTRVIGQLGLPDRPLQTAEQSEPAIHNDTRMLTEKALLLDLLHQHRATKLNTEVQQLLLDPLPILTQAFFEGLLQKARQQSIVLIFDTYEKVPTAIDLWLWYTLSTHPDLRLQNIHLVVASARSFLEKAAWQQLQHKAALLYECALEPFDQTHTAEYLKSLGITEAHKAQTIFQVTQGIPYYLNWLRIQQEAGRTVDFASDHQDIAATLLQGTEKIQQRVVQWASCCRWFDRAMFDDVIEKQQLQAQADTNPFDWLIQQPYAKSFNEMFCLDDVVRHVFRQQLWQADQHLFQQTHALLAEYFNAKANQTVSPEKPPSERYDNSAWRTDTAEFLYHSIYAGRDDAQRLFISHLLEATYLKQNEVVIIPFEVILAEMAMSDCPCLSDETQVFLNGISPLVKFDQLLEESLVENEKETLPASLFEYQGFTNASIETACVTCFREIEHLDGLAKFVALLYQAKHARKDVAAALLQDAHKLAEALVNKADPEFSSNLFLWGVGMEMYTLGRYDDATQAWKRAVELKADKHEAWHNLGLVLAHQKQYADAVQVLRRAVALKPDDQDAWYTLGLAYASQHAYEDAIQAYQWALAFDPNHLATRRNLAHVYVKQQRYDEAIASFDKVLETLPDDDRAFYGKACCYASQQDVELAVDYLRRAIELNPQNRELANAHPFFDMIREDRRFQEVLNEK